MQIADLTFLQWSIHHIMAQYSVQIFCSPLLLFIIHYDHSSSKAPSGPYCILPCPTVQYLTKYAPWTHFVYVLKQNRPHCNGNFQGFGWPKGILSYLYTDFDWSLLLKRLTFCRHDIILEMVQWVASDNEQGLNSLFS